MNQKYLDEVKRVLRTLDLTTAMQGEYLQVSMDGEELCKVYDNKMLYPSTFENPLCRSKIEEVRDVTVSVTEYVKAVENGEEFEVKGSDGWRKIADMNNVVLAGKETQYGYEFVTWEKCADGDVTWGHYSKDYANAKEDFALRAGLIDPNRYFNCGELRDIYAAIDFMLDAVGNQTLVAEDFLTAKEEQSLKEINDKIEATIGENPFADEGIEESPQIGM